MPSYAQTLTLTFLAINTVTNTSQTGDEENITLRWLKDGVVQELTGDPEITEVDTTYAAGQYNVTVAAVDGECTIGTLVGISSTANVKIKPVTVHYELLPNVFPGFSGGLPRIGQPPLHNLATSNDVGSLSGNISALVSNVAVLLNSRKQFFGIDCEVVMGTDDHDILVWLNGASGTTGVDPEEFIVRVMKPGDAGFGNDTYTFDRELGENWYAVRLPGTKWDTLGVHILKISNSGGTLMGYVQVTVVDAPVVPRNAPTRPISKV